jgi:hypothetical protein
MYKVCDKHKNGVKEVSDTLTKFVDVVLKHGSSNFLEATFEYVSNFNREYYYNMNVEISELELKNKIDILDELILYLSRKDFSNKKLVLKRLNKISISEKISNDDKQFIITYIEDKPYTQDFLSYIKNKFNVLSELELLYGKYSSILHMIIISSTIEHCFSLRFKYSSDTVELRNDNPIIIYTTNKSAKYCTKYSGWIKQLILRYCYFNYILQTANTPKVLSIFLVDFPKMLYNSGTIGPAEINTGITNGIYINITRKEEALKTLLHELIHFHNMDFRDIPEKLNTLLNKHFANTTTEGYNMKLNLFEAYTEFVASILNICLFYDYNIVLSKERNRQLYLKHFKDRLYQQIIYTNGKCYTLLNYFNCQLTIKNGNIERCNINQKTNSVSYFLIKSYLYKHILDFIQCLNIDTLQFNTYNAKSFNILYKIINAGINDMQLIKLYKLCYGDKEIRKSVQSMNSMKMVCIIET